ncbi:hypothetical protein CR513_15916, partial [Mucuna pruriens]
MPSNPSMNYIAETQNSTLKVMVESIIVATLLNALKGQRFKKGDKINIMILVTHFNLKLHQMDVKTTLLNNKTGKTIYLVQLENFILQDVKKVIYKLNKFIYKIKQVSVP